MRIQHNIMAMSAYRNYNTNTSAVAKNLEKLSSGYKINRAGDDAAGLAISEKMRAQITGLNAAQKNVKDGISLVKTAEGAMQEIQDMLNRMDYLATQSANGTYQDEVDREALQKEVNQLLDEINRIADSANFNGIKLLDGSQDTNAISGTTYTDVKDDDILALIPDEDAAVQGTVDDQKTVLETESLPASKAGFEVDLENVVVKSQNGGEFTLKIGDKEMKATLDAGSSTKGAALAEALAGANATFSFDGTNTFNVKAEGSKLIFSSDDEIASMKENATVSFEFAETAADAGEIDDANKVNLPTGEATATGTIGTGKDVSTASGVANLFENGGTLDAAKVADVINEVASSTTATDVKIAAGTGDYAGKLVLKSGDTVIAVSEEDNTGAAKTTGTTYTFKGVDKANTALGTVILVTGAAATNAVDAAGLEGATAFAVDGITVTAPTSAATAKTDDLLTALDEAGAGTGTVSVQFKETKDSKDYYTITVGGKSIDVIGSVATNKLSLSSIKEDGTADKELLSFQGAVGDDFKDLLADAFDTKIAYTGKGKAEVSGTVDGGIQNVTKFNSGAASAVANTTVDFNEVEAWTDGAKIKIGDTTYTVALGAKSAFKNAANVIDLTDMETADNVVAAKRLTAAAKDNKTFIVGHDGTGKTTLQQRLAVKDSTDMTSKAKIASYLGVSKLTSDPSEAKAGTGLQLQIGDTSDSFNQLQISIGDMHTKALGIEGLSIGNAEDAAKAIATIKNAINTVSSVRGDLGAYQNRLEHTANNLSVMAENITDAESSIRDTDIAEEMMAYTKNNILVQSAQAMLAQANQVPQGVLQLLG